MTKSSVDKSRSRYGKFVTLRFHKPLKLYHLTWNNKTPKLIAKFTETDGEYAVKLWETLEQLHKENEALKKFVKVNFNDMMAEKMEKELEK